MTNKKILTHIINLSILFSLIYILLLNSISFFVFLPIILIYIFIWKLLFGLAWHNFFILLSFSFLIFLFFFIFALTPFIYVFLILIFNILFILKVLFLREKDVSLYILIRNMFLAFIIFITSLSLYSLYYIYNTNILIVFTLLIISYIPLLYYKELIDKTFLKKSEKFLFIFCLFQISFLLFFSTSNLVIFPILNTIWFIYLFNILIDIKENTLNLKTFSTILFLSALFLFTVNILF